MKNAIVLATVALALIVAPLASAGSSLLSGYGTGGSQTVTQVKGEDETPTSEDGQPTVVVQSARETKPQSSGPSELPFTGVDLVVLVGAGLALLTIGLATRRFTRDDA